MKFHDGFVCTLSDVRYVSNLKKNHISLGTLESKVYRVTIDGRFMKVTKGDMIVMRGKRLNNLFFFLQESTVIGGFFCEYVGC